MHNLEREEKLAEYAGWVHKLSRKSDVGFTLSPDSMVEALRWLITEVHELDYKLEKKRAYIAELEGSIKDARNFTGTRDVNRG